MMFQIVDYTINIDTDNLLSLFVLTISDTSTILWLTWGACVSWLLGNGSSRVKDFERGAAAKITNNSTYRDIL